MHGTASWVPENFRIKELQTQLLAVRTSVICALNQLLDLKDLSELICFQPLYFFVSRRPVYQ